MNLLNIITPSNLGEEKQRFFKNDSYHPTFRYPWQSDKPIITIKNTKNRLIESIVSQDSASIYKYSKLYFQVDSFDLLDLANKCLAKKPVLTFNETHNDFVNGFTSAFKQLMVANAYVRVMRVSKLMSGYMGMPQEITDLKNTYYSNLSKELDRAERQYYTGLNTLRSLRRPSVQVNIRTNNAFVAQNQQLNNTNENNKPN